MPIAKGTAFRPEAKAIISSFEHVVCKIKVRAKLSARKTTDFLVGVSIHHLSSKSFKQLKTSCFSQHLAKLPLQVTTILCHIQIDLDARLCYPAALRASELESKARFKLDRSHDLSVQRYLHAAQSI
jgi:hypothetical protein